MKKCLFSILIIFLFSNFFLQSEVLTSFPDVLKPSSMVLDGDKLYIVENVNVSIYSMKDFKLIKKFGKQGEGPQEFNRFVSVFPLNDKLLINSFGKISYYTKNGDYIKEIKTKSGIVISYFPLNDKFVGYSFSAKDKTRYRSINLYSPTLEKISTIITQEDDNQIGKGQINILHSTLTLTTFDNKLYIVNGKDFEVKVFNKDAKKIYSIKRDYKKVKFTDKDKQMIYDEIKSNPQQKQYFEMIKKMMVFPDFYPSIASVFERDNILYIMTFKRDKEKYEFFMYDPDGKFLEHLFIPFSFQSPMRPNPFSIQNGNLYQLIENEDEEWELVQNSIFSSKEKFNQITEQVKKKSKLKHK